MHVAAPRTGRATLPDTKVKTVLFETLMNHMHLCCMACKEFAVQIKKPRMLSKQ